jgi:hypothetical protein
MKLEVVPVPVRDVDAAKRSLSFNECIQWN